MVAMAQDLGNCNQKARLGNIIKVPLAMPTTTANRARKCIETRAGKTLSGRVMVRSA